MSSFDPLAAIVADAALAQSAIAAIDLGVQIEILQSQLSAGDLLVATILAPQGGSDRISLLGQTVLAQLPAGIDPGQSLLLQVTGFSGNQILVRNLGIVDPNALPPTVTLELPPTPSGAPATATLRTVVPQKSQPPVTPSVTSRNAASEFEGQPKPDVTASGTSTDASDASSRVIASVSKDDPPPVAPPRAVFVAASVRPANVASLDAASEVRGQTQELSLEARIAATRAASIDIGELVSAPATTPKPSPPATPQVPTPPVAARITRAPSPPPPQVAVTATRAGAPASAPRTTPSVASPQTIAPELALLARLRVPPLPATVAAARLANNAASILPRVLARLDALLANVVANGDARVASLRNLLGFTARIDPSNPRALPEQLMAYAHNVVDGAESKLAAIVRLLSPQPVTVSVASRNAASEVEGQPRSSPAANSAPLPAAPSVADEPQTGVPPAVAARVAERAAALQYDVKAAVASLIDTPPHGASPQLAPALTEALTALTATQLNALNGQSSDPNAIVIPLPVFYHENGRPVQLRISREGGGKTKMDADNFHIAFVLDTRSLGTVAVDVQTALRAVSVNVKTEGATAAGRFRDTFDLLRGRLEQLHYRVANIAAAVAPHAPTVTLSVAEREARSEVEGQTKPSPGLDLQA